MGWLSVLLSSKWIGYFKPNIKFVWGKFDPYKFRYEESHYDLRARFPGDR